MKHLNPTIITDAKQFPFKKGTLNFLQDAHKETIANLIIGLIGSSFNALNVYVLYGCENSGSGLNYNITSGYVFYLGELYALDSTTFTASAGQVGVLSIITTQFTTDADPVTFTDASVNNVHDIRKMQVTSGASGSGLANYSSIIFAELTVSVERLRALAAELVLQNQLTLINSAWTLRADTSDVTVTGGSVTVVTESNIKYKIIGKTMMIEVLCKITNTTAPTSFDLLIPAGKTHNGGFILYDTCFIFDGATRKVGDIAITNGASVIGVTPPALTNGATTQFSFAITFEIA